MVRHSLLLLIVLYCCSYSQEEPGVLGSNGLQERDVATYSLNSKAATLVITTTFDEITVEANGREVVISAEEDDMKLYVIPANTVGLTVRVEGYEPLMMDEYPFRKNKVYDLKVFEERPPLYTVTTSGKGSLIIQSDPEGAKVTIDGMEGEWVTPATWEEIPVGTYYTTITKPDFDTSYGTVMVIGDSVNTPPPVKLRSHYGYLSMTYIVNARYFLNGVEVYTDDTTVVRLKCGIYNMLIQKPKYKDYKRDITITPGDTISMPLSLIPDFAYFDFSPLPSQTVIYLNNTIVPRRVVETVPAYHAIRITSDFFGDITGRFLLQPGETRVLEERDFLGSGKLLVNSDVPADLFLNGNQDSLSVMKTNVAPGTYLVRLTHEDFGEIERTVTVKPNEKTEIFIPMLPSRSTAIMLSIIPGASQIYNGMTLKGLAYLSGFAISIAGSYYFMREYDAQYNSYIGFVNEYRTTSDPLRITELNAAISTSYPKVQTKQDQQYIAFGITGTVFLWNIIDVFLFEPKSGYRQKDEMISDINITTDLNRMALGINVTF